MSIDHAHWSRNAADWIASARAPGHDAFWAYRNAFRAFVGEGKGEALMSVALGPNATFPLAESLPHSDIAGIHYYC